MQSATKKDIIKRYTEKRKIFTDEKEVEDILDSFLTFTLKKLKKQVHTPTYAYNFDKLGWIIEKELDIENLMKDPLSSEYKKAENMMHEFILSEARGRIKISKDYNLKDDWYYRI